MDRRLADVLRIEWPRLRSATVRIPVSPPVPGGDVIHVNRRACGSMRTEPDGLPPLRASGCYRRHAREGVSRARRYVNGLGAKWSMAFGSCGRIIHCMAGRLRIVGNLAPVASCETSWPSVAYLSLL